MAKKMSKNGSKIPMRMNIDSEWRLMGGGLFSSLHSKWDLQFNWKAGFGPQLRKWLHILLLGFKSHINHAGNLQKLIELGYDCKHFFVLAIEVLLVAKRANNKILPYRFHCNFRQGAITSKSEAYAEDLNF